MCWLIVLWIWVRMLIWCGCLSCLKSWCGCLWGCVWWICFLCLILFWVWFWWCWCMCWCLWVWLVNWWFFLCLSGWVDWMCGVIGRWDLCFCLNYVGDSLEYVWFLEWFCDVVVCFCFDCFVYFFFLFDWCVYDNWCVGVEWFDFGRCFDVVLNWYYDVYCDDIGFEFVVEFYCFDFVFGFVDDFVFIFEELFEEILYECRVVYD